MHDSNSTSPPISPFGLSLHTSFPAPRAASDCSTISPFSSATTSPASSPTSPFRRLHRGHTGQLPTSHPSDGDQRSRSQSPFRLHSLRRSSLVLLRRRPSKVDMALSEERSRCDGDSIERQGLDLMEPRPVDPVPIPMDLNASVFPTGVADRSSMQSQHSQTSQPRFVMGGIFEVMEGRA